MVRCCVPSPCCHLSAVLGLHPFDSSRRELVPWCHCATEFHLCRLFSASVPMPGLLHCRIFKNFPSVLPAMQVLFCLPPSHPSFPPGAVFWGGGVSQWDETSRRHAVRCQNHTVHLGLAPGPGCSSFQCRETTGKKVNSYSLSAEGRGMPLSVCPGGEVAVLSPLHLCTLQHDHENQLSVSGEDHCFGADEAPLPFGSL